MPSLYLYLIGGAALIFSSFGGGFYLEHRLDQGTIVQVRSDLATAKGDIITLQDGVKTSNASIESAKKNADARVAAAQAGVDAAQAKNADLAAKVAKLQSIKSDPKEDCPVADEVIREGLQ